MRRYKRLNRTETFEAFTRVRDAFLAANDEKNADKIIDGLLTHDEKLKIGRRIIIAKYLRLGSTIDEVCRELKVGTNTVIHVARRLEKYKDCFDLIEKRNKHIEKGARRKNTNLLVDLQKY